MAEKALLDHDIDRTSPEPFYMQLSNALEQAIARGEYGPGDRLPSESELCRRFDLARSTVRETLRTLEDRQLIRVVPRRGAFVRDPQKSGWVLQVAAGFFEGEVNNDRRAVDTEVLDAAVGPLDKDVSQALELPEASDGFILRRLRRLDGELALYSVNYLLIELEQVIRESAVLRSNGSLNKALRDSGYQIFGARRSVEAVPAPADIASLLDITPSSPVLLISSVSWNRSKRPFDFYRTWVRTDVVKVTVQASLGGSHP